ncbi:phosphatidylinositol-glycan biosynthesis class F protein [Anopheles maculipalpis]|uniref:phosphatidylinositol-glycan biosynthesis class F protein n=1 Tax=Anopheles maculipalpis TaxID=1496333 RepID=UPI0021591C0D|nr:phosphatidylinositol-glycan biosynthesis class F protein [Anopheles maculipalpis]
MDAQQQSIIASKMFINISILSIALNSSFFGYLLYSNRLYDVGKCCSSAVLLILPLSEVLKHFYIKHAFQLETGPKPTNPQPSSGRGSGSANVKAARARWREWFGSTVLFALTTLFYGFICVVVGAPLDQYEETLSLAVTLTTVTIFPIILLIGQSQTYQLLLSETLELKSPLTNSYLNLLKNNCIGVILGAWGASVVAPLDWDRPWQVYPIPNVVGSIGGLFGMNVFNLLSTAYISMYRNRRSKTL